MPVLILPEGIISSTGAATTAAPTTTAATPGTTTTTTVAPTTPAPETCTLVEGMDSDTTIPEENLASNPPTENLENLRPNVEGSWTVPSVNNPQVLIQVAKDGEESLPVARIELTTNAEKVTVAYQTAPDEPFQVVADKKTGTPKVGCS